LDSIGWKIWFTTPVLVSSLLIGRMLARRAPGRELAACLMYAILVSVYDLVPMFGDNGGFSTLLCIIIVLAGAAWGRYSVSMLNSMLGSGTPHSGIAPAFQVGGPRVMQGGVRFAW
jgi:hypothetical protein